MRTRKQLVREQTRHIQRMQKTLEEAPESVGELSPESAGGLIPESVGGFARIVKPLWHSVS